MNPHDELPLAHRPIQRWTLSVTKHGQARRSNVDGRKCCQLTSPTTTEFVTVSSDLCRTNLTTHCDDRHAVAKFSKSKIWDKFSEGSALELLEFPYNTA